MSLRPKDLRQSLKHSSNRESAGSNLSRWPECGAPRTFGARALLTSGWNRRGLRKFAPRINRRASAGLSDWQLFGPGSCRGCVISCAKRLHSAELASPEVEGGFVQAVSATEAANAQAAGLKIGQSFSPELFAGPIASRTFPHDRAPSKKGKAPW